MTGDLHIGRRISAPGDELWQACATARGLESWYADRVTGTVAAGERLQLEWPGLGVSFCLDVEECAAPRRVAFRNGPSVVSLEVEEGHVALTHRGLGATDDFEGFEASWRVALALLGHALESHRGKRRRASWFCRRARTTAELAQVYFSDPGGLAAWLGEATALRGDGQKYSVRSFAGEAMNGRVLVDSARDIALSWQERNNSVLVFRTLPSPLSARERVLALCWSRWIHPSGGEEDHTVTTTENELRRSLNRLGRVLDQSGSA